MKLAVLVVEDDTGMRESLSDFFSHNGCRVFSAALGVEAREIFNRNKVNFVVLDLGLPDASGLDLLREFRQSDEDATIAVITASLDARTAVQAMKFGAYDYLIKPFEIEEMRNILRRVSDLHNLRSEVRAFHHQHQKETHGLLGESAPMRALRSLILRAAEAPQTAVLITGETGTGKELVAAAIHELSRRSTKPLTKLNCGAIPGNLVESELFGHERGAFTDAKTAKPGLFELADGGTIFLDEIGEIELGVQPKLLRVLEGQPIRRVGGNREIRPDVRVVAATNRDLSALVKAGRFREDLFYRINVFSIQTPPLRERGGDVLLLADEFVRRVAADLKRRPKSFSEEARQVLLQYSWPGNVRELRNVIERALILTDSDVIGLDHLPRELLEVSMALGHRNKLAPTDGFSLEAMTRAHILYVLKQTDWNKSEAARRLGISRNTLKAKLREYGVADEFDTVESERDA